VSELRSANIFPLRSDRSFESWLEALEARHLANLTRAELTRALRALSSCYVERRAKLASGAALEGAGKRAAFALFYAPLHFLTVDRVVRALEPAALAVRDIVDLGCGTGAAGAAWALALPKAATLTGIDRSEWALQEASWTYRHFGLRGNTRAADIASTRLSARRDSGVILAYAINELTDDKRTALLERVANWSRAGARILIVEPSARGAADWWPEWRDRLEREGARADEWRFPLAAPALLRDIAKGAGLSARELTARSLFLAQ
jgi:trans-aconitate methyltransferase